MKISDLAISSLKGIKHNDGNGNVEVFYLIGMNTVRLKYNEITGIVSSLIVNGNELPLDNKEIIDEFNKAVSSSMNVNTVQSKPSILMSDLAISSLNGIKHDDGKGNVEVFYLIGMNTVRLKYNEITDVVSSIVVNKNELPLDDPNIVEQFNQVIRDAQSKGAR